jgi:hypothetical protein
MKFIWNILDLRWNKYLILSSFFIRNSIKLQTMVLEGNFVGEPNHTWTSGTCCSNIYEWNKVINV